VTFGCMWVEVSGEDLSGRARSVWAQSVWYAECIGHRVCGSGLQ
jgi:hypothetical protein